MEGDYLKSLLKVQGTWRCSEAEWVVKKFNSWGYAGFCLPVEILPRFRLRYLCLRYLFLSHTWRFMSTMLNVTFDLDRELTVLVCSMLGNLAFKWRRQCDTGNALHQGNWPSGAKAWSREQGSRWKTWDTKLNSLDFQRFSSWMFDERNMLKPLEQHQRTGQMVAALRAEE